MSVVSNTAPDLPPTENAKFNVLVWAGVLALGLALTGLLLLPGSSKTFAIFPAGVAAYLLWSSARAFSEAD